MTATLQIPQSGVDAGDGGGPARRAMLRWAWRLFRREWRQQLLVLALLILAVAATTVGAGLAANTGSSDQAMFGSADYLATVAGSDPQLAADIAAATKFFGTIEVIAHQHIAVPGSVKPIDLRAQDPNGVYSRPTLRLEAGHYPIGASEIAVTDGVAAIFDLRLGGPFHGGGHGRIVVGLVENPANLGDEFALVAPEQANPPIDVTILVKASAQTFNAFRAPGGLSVAVRPPIQSITAAVAVLVLATIGLLFVGLVAVAGFTVMAQRRMRALGMVAALGATERHVRLMMLANGLVVGAAAAVTGTALGLASWFAVATHLERIVEHRIDRFNLPWWAIVTAMLLAIVTALIAAWWPARSVARIPIVAALSARPSRPRPAHRFAALGSLVLLAGLALLALSHQKRPVLIVTGIVAVTVGVLLLAPLSIRGLGAVARRSPIALRLALRDLARYQARSGAALAAVSLTIGIAAAIAIGATASQTNAESSPTSGNLPANQLIVWLSPDGGIQGPVPQHTTAELDALQPRVASLASALHAQSIVPLDVATNPSSETLPGVDGSPGGKPAAALGKPIPEPGGRTRFDGRDDVALFVATPALIDHYGIDPSTVDSDTDILTSHTSLAGMELIPGRNSNWHPKIQTVNLPTYTSDPTTLITTHALDTLGLQSMPAGWLIQTPQPLTNAQITTARQTAAAAGVSIETRPTQASLAQLRNDATAVGMLVALGVLAMTVGLIRSETAGDLRTLTAAGASSTTRRAVTGATAAALALLGSLLGTLGAYLALIAWHRSHLHTLSHVPIAHLATIVVGLPLAAAMAGWVLAGREPGRRALE